MPGPHTLALTNVEGRHCTLFVSYSFSVQWIEAKNEIDFTLLEYLCHEIQEQELHGSFFTAPSLPFIVRVIVIHTGRSGCVGSSAKLLR